MNKRPIQVYLDTGDRKLLDSIAKRYDLSIAETVRMAIRRWASEVGEESDPVLAMIGSLDGACLPIDLSTRHDEYAVLGYSTASGRVAERGEHDR